MNRALTRLGAVAQRGNFAAFTNFTRHSSGIARNTPEEFKTHDGLFETMQVPQDPDQWDPTGRTHHYVVMGGARVVYATMGRLSVMKIVGSLSATADVLALGTVEVDLAGIAEGTSAIVKWRGKPVFVKHRTAKEIASAQADDNAELRDPQTDAERVKVPEWMIVLGICTHLGCVPTGEAGDFGAWFCPCHGSHYDLSGRIRKGPAPLNLEVPEYTLEGTTLKLGS